MRRAVSSTRGGPGDHGGRKKQLDYFLGPRNLPSGDLVSEPAEDSHLGTLSSDHQSGKGKNLAQRSASRVEQGGRPCPKERWTSSRNLCSDLEVPVMKSPCAKLKMEKDWVHLHDWLVTAASEIKATTTSSRNRKKFCVPEEIRRLACDAAKCRDTVRRRRLRKIAMRARREFEAGKAVLRRGKVINRPVVTKFWGNGRASEDRDERREVRAHCERCYDDKEETSEVRAERILSQ